MVVILVMLVVLVCHGNDDVLFLVWVCFQLGGLGIKFNACKRLIMRTRLMLMRMMMVGRSHLGLRGAGLKKKSWHCRRRGYGDKSHSCEELWWPRSSSPKGPWNPDDDDNENGNDPLWTAKHAAPWPGLRVADCVTIYHCVTCVVSLYTTDTQLVYHY